MLMHSDSWQRNVLCSIIRWRSFEKDAESLLKMVVFENMELTQHQGVGRSNHHAHSSSSSLVWGYSFHQPSTSHLETPSITVIGLEKISGAASFSNRNKMGDDSAGEDDVNASLHHVLCFHNSHKTDWKKIEGNLDVRLISLKLDRYTEGTELSGKYFKFLMYFLSFAFLRRGLCLK